jgi:hypothetical protein
MARQATGSVVAKKFAHAYEESERLAAELGMFQRENAMLKDEIERSVQTRFARVDCSRRGAGGGRGERQTARCAQLPARRPAVARTGAALLRAARCCSLLTLRCLAATPATPPARLCVQCGTHRARAHAGAPAGRIQDQPLHCQRRNR